MSVKLENDNTISISTKNIGLDASAEVSQKTWILPYWEKIMVKIPSINFLIKIKLVSAPLKEGSKNLKA